MAAGFRSVRSNPSSSPTSAVRSGATSGSSTSTRMRTKPRSAPTSRRLSLERDRDSWVEELSAADTCVAPVLDPAEATDNAQYAYRGAFVQAEHPTAGRFMQVGAVLAGMPKIQAPVVLPDPGVTQTVEILRDAGVSEANLAAMQTEGVLA